jgi:protein-disulfide isomerase
VERLILAAVLVAVAAAAAFVLRRRTATAPPTQAKWAVPTQLDRDDFASRELAWLVVVFTSATCDSCVEAVAKARVLASPQVGFQEVAYQDRKHLHTRYGVEAVPTIVMADAEGVVQASFVGVPSATDLWAALAEARSAS